MVEVVVYQDPLGARHRAFNSGKLAGDVEAGLVILDHGDHVAQMAFGPFQPPRDFEMGCMRVKMWHKQG